MDTEKCSALISIIENGSMSAAADKLGYTTSGLSRMINSLEEQAGFSIVKRGRHGVELTKEGEELMPVIKQLAFWGERYEQEAKKICGVDTGRVLVGTAYSAYYPWLADVIAGFHEKYEGIRVEVIEGSSSKLGALIDERELDFCIISSRPGEHDWVPLLEDEMMALLPKKHHLASEKKFAIKNLEVEPFVEILQGEETDNSRMFKRYGIKPKVSFATVDSYAAYSMVRAGLGVAIVNKIDINENYEGIVKMPLEPRETISIGIALPKAEMISPAARRFAEYALNCLPKDTQTEKQK